MASREEKNSRSQYQDLQESKFELNLMFVVWWKKKRKKRQDWVQITMLQILEWKNIKKESYKKLYL